MSFYGEHFSFKNKSLFIFNQTLEIKLKSSLTFRQRNIDLSPQSLTNFKVLDSSVSVSDGTAAAIAINASNTQNCFILQFFNI